MASSQAIRAGRAFVELFADDSKLVRGLKGASSKLKAWGGGIRSLGTKVFAAGAAVLTPMLVAVRQFMSTGDALDKMSSRVGASVEFLSALSHAAQIGGTELSAMEVGIRRLQRSAYDATQGTKTTQDAFEQLGISVAGADGKLKSTEELFMESATALSKLENNTQKAALSTIIFGRAGTSLLPMLKDGADGLVAVMEEAKRLGLVMSTEDATAAAVLTDAWTRLTSSLKMAVIRIGGSLAPNLTELADRVTSMLRPVIDWIHQNKQLIVTVAAVAAGVMAGGAALIVLGTVVSAAGALVGALGTALSLVASVATALVSPLGLVVAGIAGLVYYSGAGAAALDWLAGMFGYLREVATRAWGGIADAMAAGDLALAAKIAWLSIKMLWQEGINWLYGKWVGFKETFLAVWNEAAFGLAKVLTTAWYEGLKAYTNVVNTMRVMWARFTVWAGNTWNKAQQSIGTVFLEALGKVGALDKEELSGRLQAKIGARTAAGQEDLAKIGADWEGKIQDLDQQETDAQKALDEDKAARNRARRQQYAKDLQEAQGAVEKAKTKWEQALAEAARKRAGIEAGAGPEKPAKPGEPDFAGVGKASVKGTFSAIVAARIGAGGPAERTARATEEAAGHLKYIRRRFEFTGPTTSTFQ